MVNDNGDRLGSELQRAYGRDLPGDDFDEVVMERTLADSGGEHEIALDAPRGRRWWPFAVAAAVVLLVVGAWQLSGPAPQEPPPFRPLPTLAAPGNERIVIDLEVDGTIRVGGQVLTEEELKAYLTLRVAECRGDRDPQEPYVFLNGKKGVFPPSLERIARLCSDPPISIRKIQYGSDGKVTSTTWPTPPVSETNRHIVHLERGQNETTTRVRLDDRDLGTGDAAFAALEAEMKKLTVRVGTTPGGAAASPETKLAGAINAGPLVPHPEVIRAIDAFMKVHIFDITFFGAPPPGTTQPRPSFNVYLHLVDERTLLTIGKSRTQYELDDGLVALAAALEKLTESGEKPMCILDAAVYMDQDAVTRVLEVFKKHGIEDVTIIH